MCLAVPRSTTVQESHDRGVSLYQLCMVGGEHERACMHHGTVKKHRMGLYPFSQKLRFEIVNMHRVCVRVHHFVGIRHACVIEDEKTPQVRTCQHIYIRCACSTRVCVFLPCIVGTL